MDTQNNTQDANPQGAVEDIVSRVAQAGATEATDTSTPDSLDSKLQTIEKSINTAFITPEQLSQIKDPVARQFLDQKQKEMMSGMNEKFREIADLGKSLKAQQQQPAQPQGYVINSEADLLQALNDPKFADLVQGVAQQSAPSNWDGTEQQWSSLTSEEQSEFMEMKNEIKNLRNIQNQNEMSKIDESIKQKYPNYDSSKINSFITDVNSGKLTTADLREFAHKALNFEESIKRAYQIARDEANGNIGDKVNASDFGSGSSNQVTINQVPKREANESTASHFARIMQARLSKT